MENRSTLMKPSSSAAPAPKQATLSRIRQFARASFAGRLPAAPAIVLN